MTKEDNVKKIISSIKRKLVTRMKTYLVPLGFTPTTTTYWNRYTKTLRHTFEFRQLNWREFHVRHGLQILDPFGDSEKNSDSYCCSIEKHWKNLPKDNTEIDKFLDGIMLHIKHIEETFFSKYQEVAQLIRDYDLKKIPKEYLSESICWRNHRMGIAYFDAKKYSQAMSHFQKVIDLYSDDDLEFVRIRKASAEKWISKIKKLQSQ